MKELQFPVNMQIYGCQVENGNMYVLPPMAQPRTFEGERILWILDGQDQKSVKIECGRYLVERSEQEVKICIDGDYQETVFAGLPDCDFLGNQIQIRIDDKEGFQQTLLQFYWKSLLNECAERTFMAHDLEWREGYVLSTLQLSKYAGTYPAVDHEFHIRGRLALGGAFELEVVRRMMELQIRTMLTDPSGQYRIPCSVQPSGEREYHITRKSMDGITEARMFPYTGIMELCQEMYDYCCLTNDKAFVIANIKHLEDGLRFMEKDIDEAGRLWADVYYEDQVMKDGTTAQAQAFGVQALECMAKLEFIAGNDEKAEWYRATSEKMQVNYVKTVPEGFWDPDKGRYVDWIDRQGEMHDHIHLLANALSVTYDFNDRERDALIYDMIHENDDIFQKFPSYVAAKIEDYTDTEIGDGGPYDLCAAGRYWCHDAKYRHKIGEVKTLKTQLEQVVHQAKTDEFYMGERYDMNYIYYNTGADGEKNWHGASKYYEYPNVYADVLIHDFFGMRPDEEADLLLQPCCSDNVSIILKSKGISYTFKDGRFTLKNISDKMMKVKVDLSRILNGFREEILMIKSGEEKLYE